jgi:hypothetical protein
MRLSRRLLFSSLLGIALAVLLIAGSVSALVAYGDSQNQQAQTGWNIQVAALTGPSDFLDPIQINGMLVTGSCTLSGSSNGGMSGTSGQCQFLGIVDAQGMPLSVCFANIPVSYWTQVPPGPDAPLSALSGKPDLRVFSNSFALQGRNTNLCGGILFDGNSADLFVPAAAGSYNFGGDTLAPIGTFLFYHANVRATYS